MYEIHFTVEISFGTGKTALSKVSEAKRANEKALFGAFFSRQLKMVCLCQGLAACGWAAEIACRKLVSPTADKPLGGQQYVAAHRAWDEQAVIVYTPVSAETGCCSLGIDLSLYQCMR